MSGSDDDAHAAKPAADQRVSMRALDGLRFAHGILGQQALEQIELKATVLALVDLLVEKGWLSAAELDSVREPTRARLISGSPTPFALDPNRADKYAHDCERLDCAGRLASCQAACCHRSFALTRQDIEERVLRWDPLFPYWLLQEPDGRCYHLDPETLRCRVYAQRPSECRRFSCKEDASIWADFDEQVPAARAQEVPNSQRDGDAPSK